MNRVLGFGMLCLSLPALGMDLVDSLALAKEHDPVYLAARHELGATGEARIQARAGLLPQVSYQFEFRETDQDIIEAQNAVFDNTSNSFRTETRGLTVSQTLFNYEKFQRYSQSKATVNRAESEFLAAQQDMYLRVAEAYFLVLERQDQLGTVQAEKEAMEKHLALAERKVARGLSRSVDEQEARAKYLNALSKEIELESFLLDAKYALRESIGQLPEDLQPLKTGITLENPVPENPEQWVDLAEAHNPVLQASMLRVREASKEVNALKGRHYPTLDLVYTDTNRDAGGSLFDGGSETDTAEIALQLNIPLYSGGAASSRVRQATNTKYRVEEELTRQKREIQRSTVDAMRRIGAAIAQIQALEQSVEAHRQTLEIKQRGYGAGRYHIIEVLDAQQELSAAQQMLTKSRYDYALNTLRLKYAAGVISEEDMHIVNGWLQGNEPWAGPVYDPEKYRQNSAADVADPVAEPAEMVADAEEQGENDNAPAQSSPTPQQQDGIILDDAAASLEAAE